MLIEFIGGGLVSLGLVFAKPSSLGFKTLRTPFTRIYIAGLQLGETPTHSSTIIVSSGSLLWGNPRNLAYGLYVNPSWVSIPTRIAGLHIEI
jgi:hypothetical protein